MCFALLAFDSIKFELPSLAWTLNNAVMLSGEVWGAFLSLSVQFMVVVVVISGLLNNINNKENNSKPEKGHSDKTIENNSKPEKGHSDKTIYVKTCTCKKTIGKWFEKSAWSLHLIILKRAVFF